MGVFGIFRRRPKTADSAGAAGHPLKINPHEGDAATIDRHMMRNARIRQKISELDPVGDAGRIAALQAELTLREAALKGRGR